MLGRSNISKYVRDRPSEGETVKGIDSSSEGESSDRIFSQFLEHMQELRESTPVNSPRLIRRHLKI